jgi:GNAT superfamily N-acetyltransferase
VSRPEAGSVGGMIRLEHVDWLDPRAVALRAAMDTESGALYVRDMARMPKADRELMTRLLTVDPATIVTTLIAVDDAAPAATADAGATANTRPVPADVGHAALKRLSGDLAGAFEVKKVFVEPERRGEGISRVLMAALEPIARELGAERLVLQTGDRQEAAIALYQAIGYEPMPPFGGYEIFPPTLCYAKTLA